MTIEFPCPQCAQLVRTPDAAAGKKGKCPSCGVVVRIPTADAAAPAPAPKPAVATKPAAAPKPAVATKPAATADAGPIEFNCPGCGGVVRTPRTAAGKKGKCPTCAAVVVIPHESPAVPAPAAPKPAAKPAQKPAAAATKPQAPAAPMPAPVAAVKKEPKPQPAAAPQAARPTQPVAKKAVVDDIGLAPLDDLAPLPDLDPLPELVPVQVPVKAKVAPRAPAPPGNDAEIIDLSQYDDEPTGALPPLVAVAIDSDPFTTGRPEIGAELKEPVAAINVSATAPIAPAAPALTPLPAAELSPLQPLSPLSPLQPLQPLQPLSGFNDAFAPQPAPSAGLPYQSAGGAALGGTSPAAVNIPAILQIVAIVPWMLLGVWGLLRSLLAMVTGRSPGGEQLPANMVILFAVVGLVLGLVLFAIHAVIILGSVRQLQRRNYVLSHFAAWLSLIPCFSPMGLPFGVWSLVMLFRDEVQRSFR